jgi:predicted ATPase
MDFRILGPLEIAVRERPLPLRGGKQRALIGMLVVHANEVVSKDRLVDEFWRDEPFEAALNTLQVTISRLRKGLERDGDESRLLTQAPGYLLRIELEELDAAVFERLLADGRAALADGLPEQAAEQLQSALALWRGPALADFRYERFAQSEIARLEELRLVCLEERIEAELALARQAELVPELEALVKEQPLRERFRFQLMLALYRCGRQAEALELYQQSRRTLQEELGLDPSPELQELERKILQQEPGLTVAAPPRRVPTNLPAPPTPLVGRERELGELEALLRRPQLRLLTLTGAGGTGKTRLALEAAARALPAFERHGVWWIPLAALQEPALVLPSVANALGLGEAGPLPLLERLKSFLQERELLLVLDNFEHLLGAAAELAELLAAGPGIKALVTSRERLRLRGEHEYVLPPLVETEAVALFVERAQEANRDFEPEREAEAVTEICARLDGLPLAIELAAAHVRHLAPTALLARLEQRLPLLSGGARDLPARQQALRDTIAWSYELLVPAERELFARLAIFAGGCTIEAAEQVCAAEPELLASLVEKSLLRREPGAEGEPRLLMLETIREYAAERLAETGETEKLAAAHAHYFADFAERAEPELLEGEQVRWLALLERERDNLRAALRWALAGGDGQLALRLATASYRLWLPRGSGPEAARWLDAALACDSGAPTYRRALALHGAANLARMRSDFAQAQCLAKEGLEMARAVGDLRLQGLCASMVATIAGYEGDLARARAMHEEAVALLRRADRPREVGWALFYIGDVYLNNARYREAIDLCAEAVDVLTKISNAEGMALALGRLGQALLLGGREEEAAPRLRECIASASGLGHPVAVAWAFEGLAALAAREGELERALRLIGAADAARERAGTPPMPANVLVRERALAPARERLADAAVAELIREGRELDFGEAVAYALEDAVPAI